MEALGDGGSFRGEEWGRAVRYSIKLSVLMLLVYSATVTPWNFLSMVLLPCFGATSRILGSCSLQPCVRCMARFPVKPAHSVILSPFRFVGLGLPGAITLTAIVVYTSREACWQAIGV